MEKTQRKIKWIRQSQTKKYAWSACLFFVVVFVQAQPDSFTKIDQLFSAWNNATPGMAVAVEQGDKIIYNKAFGLADLEHTTPNTTETVFESGSVAKQFTAMSILLLAAEGKLALTDDVRKYVPDLPTYSTTITLQMLLNHTSGLKDWGSVGSLSGWPRTTRVYTQDLALQIMCKQRSTNFTPGTEYSYSNANYSLLVTIVERVSGKSLAAFTEEKFFKPLGMVHTRWRDNFRTLVPHRAIAYRTNKSRYEQLMPFEDVHGHGGLLTTTGDLLKWNRLLENHVIGGPSVYQQRIRKGKLTNGREIAYAAGLHVGTYFGFDEISHSGATAGYRAWLAYYPDKKLSIVILSNDGNFNPTTVGRQVADVLLADPNPPEVPEVTIEEPDSTYAPSSYVPTEPDLKKFEGIWRSIRHMDVQRVERKENTLFKDKTRAVVLDQQTIYFDEKWTAIKTNRVRVARGTDTLTYVKVAAPDLTDKAVAGLVGTYYSEEADATYRITVQNQVVWVHNAPFPAYELTASFRDAFFSADGNLYEFKRDKKGKAIQLQVSTSRAMQVTFRKIY